ncbi:hypothetical protein [Staphylococcus xylosus]|uniref:hypothetical protein n=1 Tax=Staphylococcus xylosus TaxID=1288 RepID=UPI001E364313|nr:hypothetical protein [Staphylococcus xylosus]MCD8851135.1 hypothetical protein [Staphylococcus xylosus]
MGIYHLNKDKDVLTDVTLNEKQEQVSTFINKLMPGQFIGFNEYIASSTSVKYMLSL